jgi:hypothetical protein
LARRLWSHTFANAKGIRGRGRTVAVMPYQRSARVEGSTRVDTVSPGAAEHSSAGPERPRVPVTAERDRVTELKVRFVGVLNLPPSREDRAGGSTTGRGNPCAPEVLARELVTTGLLAHGAGMAQARGAGDLSRPLATPAATTMLTSALITFG